METITKYLKDNIMCLPSQTYMGDYLDKLGIKISPETSALLPKVNPYRLNLIQPQQREIDLCGDLPTAFYKTESQVIVATRSGNIRFFDKNNLKLAKNTLTLPNCKIQAMAAIDEPQTLIVATPGQVTVYTKQGVLTKTLKEFYTVREHAGAQVTALQLLPLHNVFQD